METAANAGTRALRILAVSCGSMDVEDLDVGKDFKLYPGGGRAWDWAGTGIPHSPGIQPADIEELLPHGATTVVLSQGMNQRLQIHPATRHYLHQHAVTVLMWPAAQRACDHGGPPLATAAWSYRTECRSAAGIHAVNTALAPPVVRWQQWDRV